MSMLPCCLRSVFLSKPISLYSFIILLSIKIIKKMIFLHLFFLVLAKLKMVLVLFSIQNNTLLSTRT